MTDLTDYELVMYVRTAYCPGVALARDLLIRYEIPYREINIDDDTLYAKQVKAWNGSYTVPTLVIAHPGQDIPYTTYAPTPEGQPLRGYDRGPLITEPNNIALENWLHKHGFLDKPYRR